MDELNKSESVALEILLQLIESQPTVNNLDKKANRYARTILSDNGYPNSNSDSKFIAAAFIGRDAESLKAQKLLPADLTATKTFEGNEFTLSNFTLNNKTYWFYYLDESIEDVLSKLVPVVLDFYNGHVL